MDQATGIKAYALYAQAACEKLGLQEICQEMKAHGEEYEHLGEVQTWIQDMHPMWEARKNENSLSLSPDKIFMQWEIKIELSSEKVWDYLSQPVFRKTLIGTERMEEVNRDGGRITSGSVYHCFHGKQVVLQIVLEWQPFERVITKDRRPVPLMDIFVYQEYRLEPDPPGTPFPFILSGRKARCWEGLWRKEYLREWKAREAKICGLLRIKLKRRRNTWQQRQLHCCKSQLK